jgi:hypothetical protein
VKVQKRIRRGYEKQISNEEVGYEDAARCVLNSGSCDCCFSTEQVPSGVRLRRNVVWFWKFRQQLQHYNGHPQVTFPANARIDSSFQQASVHPENGQSDAHSPLTAQQIPKGIYIVPYGSDDHEKGWAAHSPELKGIEWDDNATITRYVFGMTLYCATGSGEADRLVGGCNVYVDVGGCNVNVDVCYQPKVPIIAKKMGVILRAANLRSDPSTAHKPVGLLYTNEEVELLSSEAVRGFFQVKTKDGRQVRPERLEQVRRSQQR